MTTLFVFIRSDCYRVRHEKRPTWIGSMRSVASPPSPNCNVGIATERLPTQMVVFHNHPFCDTSKLNIEIGVPGYNNLMMSGLGTGRFSWRPRTVKNIMFQVIHVHACTKLQTRTRAHVCGGALYWPRPWPEPLPSQLCPIVHSCWLGAWVKCNGVRQTWLLTFG